MAKDDQERARRLVDDRLETLPAVPPDRSLDQLTPAELLSDTTRLALLRQREILLEPVAPDMDLKRARLILETAASVVRAAVRVQEATLRERRARGLQDILKALKEPDLPSHGPSESDPLQPLPAGSLMVEQVR